MGLIFLAGQKLLRDNAQEAAGLPSVTSLTPADAPTEITGILSQIDGAGRRALDRVGVGKLLGKRRPAETVAALPPPFADSGRPREIAAVKRSVRGALRNADQVARVQAWHGVIVLGERAVARADIERLVQLSSGREIAQPAERLTFGLTRGPDGWQLVTGR